MGIVPDIPHDEAPDVALLAQAAGALPPRGTEMLVRRGKVPLLPQGKVPPMKEGAGPLLP